MKCLSVLFFIMWIHSQLVLVISLIVTWIYADEKQIGYELPPTKYE